MLKNILKNHNVILASGSPRRQQFLKDLDIPFSIQLFEVEEIYPDHLKGTEITDFLAKLKATPFDNTLKDHEIVITSDTIVWQDGSALGKPKNKEEAFQMLKSLSGKKHEVISSVCLKTKEFSKIFNDTTLVHFSILNDNEIEYYIDVFQPFDKAGSYGIQEWIGYIGVEKIEGSYFNVMGLPVHKLYKELKELGS